MTCPQDNSIDPDPLGLDFKRLFIVDVAFRLNGSGCLSCASTPEHNGSLMFLCDNNLTYSRASYNITLDLRKPYTDPIWPSQLRLWKSKEPDALEEIEIPSPLYDNYTQQVRLRTYILIDNKNVRSPIAREILKFIFHYNNLANTVQPCYPTTTAVPYTRISAAPPISMEVANRISTIAFAPKFFASSIILSSACSRDSAIIFV